MTLTFGCPLVVFSLMIAKRSESVDLKVSVTPAALLSWKLCANCKLVTAGERVAAYTPIATIPATRRTATPTTMNGHFARFFGEGTASGACGRGGNGWPYCGWP